MKEDWRNLLPGVLPRCICDIYHCSLTVCVHWDKEKKQTLSDTAHVDLLMDQKKALDCSKLQLYQTKITESAAGERSLHPHTDSDADLPQLNCGAEGNRLCTRDGGTHLQSELWPSPESTCGSDCSKVVLLSSESVLQLQPHYIQVYSIHY